MTSHAIAQFRRAELEARIEELIALLDLLDGDPDLEPSLGWAPLETAFERYGYPGDEEQEEGDPAEMNGDELDTCFSEDGL